MEGTSLNDLPLELHSLIISFVDRVQDLIVVKRICKKYNKIANEVNFMEKITGIKWDQDTLKYFLNRKSIGAEVSIEQVKERWIKDKEYNRFYAQYKYVFKTLLFGNVDVGKTTLSLSAKVGQFNPAQPFTMICDFVTKQCNAYNIPSQIQFWDPSGQERYRVTLTRQVYRNPHSALLCFDLTDRSTFVKLIELWMRTFVDHKDVLTEDCVFYMVGLKADLKDPKDNFSAEAEYLAKQFNMRYYEVSALKYEGVEEMMQQLNLDMLKAHCLRPLKVREAVAPQQPKDEGRWGCSMM